MSEVVADPRTLRAFTPRVGRGDPDARPAPWRDEIRQIVAAAPGWWVVFKCLAPDGFEYDREAIAAWALVSRSSGRLAVVPLIVGDGPELTEATSDYGREFRYLEHAEDGAA